MNTDQDRHGPRRGWLRAGLLILAATVLQAGFWALLFPRAFYDDFPFSGWDWVSTLGAYNGHLVRDYGAMNLAMCFLLVAAIFLERRLSQVALGTLLVFAVPHFAFHLTEIQHFSPFQNAAQFGGLGLQILLPSVLLTLTGRRGDPKTLGHVEHTESCLKVDG
ncbi:MAG TPA: hypothetical protein VFJ72_14655 [Rubrobacteraceae bacterium]|nr:hypothetical protein [Rubrobacteraceae bacterium]